MLASLLTAAEERTRERFEKDTVEHQMQVLHNEELYRHVRFKRPKDSTYYFDLVTWPGHLVMCGDAGDYHFSRVPDMFEFFEDHGRINPQYWSEKLRGHDRHRDVSERYSREEYERQVKSWMNDQIQDIRINCGAEEFEDDEEELPDDEREFIEREITKQTDALRNAVREQLLTDYGDMDDEGQAIGKLMSFDHRGLYISDAWEWDLRVPDEHFLWCCWAIARGIVRFRAIQHPELSDWHTWPGAM